MKTTLYFRLVLFIFSFCLINLNGYGQEVVEQYNSNGLSTTVFKTSLGKITVYLPEYNSNENISGTLNIEASGSSENKKKKSLSKIEHFKLTLGNQVISLQSKTFRLTIPKEANNQLLLLNDKGHIIGESQVQKKKKETKPKSVTYIPEYMVSDGSAQIRSKFDGTLQNYSIKINNIDVPILAASKSGMFFKVPTGSIGESPLQFTNNNEVIETTVHILDLNLSVGKTSLMSGETTHLSMEVSGLEGLEKEVPVVITNNSISNILLEGGNFQKLVISPQNDVTSGVYSKNVTVKALQRGGFSISVNVEPPKPDAVLENSEGLLCNCYIDGRSYLINSKACIELGGNCEEAIKENELPEEIEDGSVSNFNFKVPSVFSFDDKQINLKVEDYNENECVGVLFFFKTIDAKEWKTIGSDFILEDRLSLNWSPPVNLNGIIEIKANVVNKNNAISQKSRITYFHSQSGINDNGLEVFYTVSDSDIKRALDKAKRTGDAIDDLEDEIYDKWGKQDSAEERKKKNEALKNKLITIDKVLDRIPKTYKDEFKKILDSLASLKSKLPQVVDNEALQNAIDDAQSRADDCEKRLENLKKEQRELEQEKDRLKEETGKALEKMDAFMKEGGMTGGYGYHSDGRYWYGYLGDENTDRGLLFSKKHNQLQKKLHGLKKQYLKTIKRLGNLPGEISEAENDCEELNKALEKAKNAKKNADLHAATELKADDICRQIKRLLKPLRRWCNQSPNHCDFNGEIEELLKKCPKNSSELDEFWKKLNEIISRKKQQEKSFGKAAEKDQKEIDGIDNDISGLEDRIKNLKERRRKEFQEADRLRRQRAAAAADAKARAETKKRERNRQKKEDKKIKNLIKKAKSDDAGDGAFKDLLKGMGLDLLDEASGNLKLGKIIGGILVIKDMPDCVCPLIKALRDAIAAHNRGEDPFVYVNDYILKWKKCANLPSISSIMEGSQELTEAIQRLNKKQTSRALKALNQAIRIQCK